MCLRQAQAPESIACFVMAEILLVVKPVETTHIFLVETTVYISCRNQCVMCLRQAQAPENIAFVLIADILLIDSLSKPLCIFPAETTLQCALDKLRHQETFAFFVMAYILLVVEPVETTRICPVETTRICPAETKPNKKATSQWLCLLS